MSTFSIRARAFGCGRSALRQRLQQSGGRYALKNRVPLARSTNKAADKASRASTAAWLLLESTLYFFFDEKPAPPTLGKQRNVEPVGEIAGVDRSTVTENAVRSAKQAKSLLAGLGIDTEIRLRWALRDILGKRTKMLPIGQNDLDALINLGFVGWTSSLA